MKSAHSPRPRSPNLLLLVRVVAYALALSAVFNTRSATAEETSLVADGDIYLDLEEKKFSTPIPYGERIKIVLVAPEGSSATLEYWWQNGNKDCDSRHPNRRDLRGLSAAPGLAMNGKQKLQFDVPALVPNGKYCFDFKLKKTRSMSPSEREQFAQGFAKAAQKVGTSAYSPANFGVTCSGDNTPTGGVWPRCAFVALVVAELRPELRTREWKIGALKLKTTEAISHLLSNTSEGQAFLVAINGAVSKFQNSELAKDEFEISNRKAQEIAAKVVAETRAIYDPLATTTVDVCDLFDRSAEEGKTQWQRICGDKKVSADRSAFLKALHDGRLQYGKSTDKAWDSTKINTAAGTAVLAYLKLAPAPDRIELPGFLLYEKLRLLDDAKTDRAANLATLGKYLAKFSNPAVSSSWDFSGNALTREQLLELAFQIAEMTDYLADIVAFKSYYDSLLTSEVFTDLVARTSTMDLVLGDSVDVFVRDGTFANRAPYYIGLDVGLALLTFHNANPAVAQYFGANFYPAAVDPNEPLYGNGRFWRNAFSITLGVSTTGKGIKNTRNFEGVIGDQILLAGLGLRLSHVFRVSGGGYLYSQPSTNPLVEDSKLRVRPYVALSLDLAAFQFISSAFAGK